MPRITSSVWVDAPRDRVYAIAKDAESFPSYMADVEKVTVLEREGGRVVSDWVGSVAQFRLKVRWRQEDQWDDEAYVCRFRQVSGDYDSMAGEWRFTEENGGTRFVSDHEYEYRVPGLGALVAGVVQKLVQQNIDNALNAIKARAEASQE